METLITYGVRGGILKGCTIPAQIHKKITHVIDDQKKADLISLIVASGNIQGACRTLGVSDTAVYQLRMRDEAFKQAMDDAVEASKPVLIKELRERVLKGTPEDIYYKGEVVGQKHYKSDALLMFAVKEAYPSYRDRVDLALSGGVDVSHGITEDVQGVIDAVYQSVGQELLDGCDAEQDQDQDQDQDQGRPGN